jgi:hypothetical protein
MAKYRVEDVGGGVLVDKRIFLREKWNGKTPEQLRQEFYQSWEDQLVGVFPLTNEGETSLQLLERRELYERPHAEIYSLHVKTGRTFDTTHVKFMEEAKLAGLHIETVVAMDTSSPWYRRILRREPQITTFTFVLIAPPHSAPQK